MCSSDLQGTVQGDYGVARSWFEVLIGDGESQELPLVVAKGIVSTEIDFRAKRAEGDIVIEAGDTINLTLKSADRCDLNGPPNVGLSDHYQLEVVTPDELLSRLESQIGRAHV